MIPNPFKRFGLCWSKVLFFVGLLALAIAQPARAEVKFRFSDSVPSMGGGYVINGIPSVYFIDTGENRWQKSGRVIKESIGGPLTWGRELGQVASFPFREPVVAGAAALGVGLVVANDYKITSFYQDEIEPMFDWFTPRPIVARGTPGVLGAIADRISYEDQYMLLGMALTYGYGFAFNDERAQVAALLSSKAVAYSFLTTQIALKPLFGRMRPVPNLSTWNLGEPEALRRGFTTNPYLWRRAPGIQINGHVGTAFPSFHYTQYFAVARVYSGVYDNSWVPYAVAGVAAVSNIRGHRHWVGDMVAGAVVGTVIGQVVLDSYKERRGLDMTFTPMLSTKSAGFQMSMSF